MLHTVAISRQHGSGGSIVFLGGNDLGAKGKWEWADGTAFWDTSSGAVGNLYSNWSSPPRATAGDCAGMQADGTYAERNHSLSFPRLPLAELLLFLRQTEGLSDAALIDQLHDWVRRHVPPQLPGGPADAS